MSMSDTDAPLDQKIFDFTSNSGQLWGRAVNDAYNAANNWLSVTRSGYVVGTITLAGTAINLNGTVNTGVLNAGSVMTCHNSLSITADTGQGATLWLNMASGQPSQIVSSRPAPAGTRWNVQLGNGQDNDNFYIHRYDDTGGYLDAPLTINRATAAVTMLGVVTAGAFSTSGTVTANSGATVGGLHSTAGVAADGAVTAGSSVTAGGTVYIANTVAANAYQLWGIAGYQTISFTTDGWLLQHENSSGNLSYFPPAGGAIFWTAGIDFHVRGNVVAANVSDERAKRHVEAYTRGLADLIRLRPIIYSYNGRGGTIDDGARRIGLNARESQPFIPECVIPTPEPPPGAMRQDGTRATVPDDRLPNQLSLDDRPLLYALLNGMRELAEQNTALVARITALEAKGTTA
jgi:hypothetical protein